MELGELSEPLFFDESAGRARKIRSGDETTIYGTILSTLQATESWAGPGNEANF